jgi:dolichol-phosphate mannosyltransferase
MRGAGAGAAALRSARWAAAAAALARLGRGARRAGPLAPRPLDIPRRAVSVVVPARDEERRIAPLLRALAADDQALEVIVVDDQSSDGTAALAVSLGARVVAGAPLPTGWVGKPWALHQGLAAARGHWLVTLDADVEPRPGLLGALVHAAEAQGADLLTAGGRFVCDTPGQRLLHPAMLATLVYRFGPPGARRRPPPSRAQANGQCTITRRAALAAAGGFAPVAGNLTDDVALARHLARRGWHVAFADATRLLDVRMHDSGADVWRSWGRSLPMPDVTSRRWQAADLAVVWLAVALPLPRLLSRRGDALDAVLVCARVGLLAGLAPAYRHRGPAWWLSPLVDVPVAARLTAGALRPGRTWRGRTYPAAGGHGEAQADEGHEQAGGGGPVR